MLELLAPAGDAQCLDAAIACGADAVYLGLDKFNARMKAGNFTADDLAKYVRKAHFFGVKVYVTLNTILQNSEIDEMLSLARAALDSKVDAFIVQDLGAAYLLKNKFDGVTLHASTQLGVHNLYGAKVAESIGFKRVVLSRETKLEDIRQIRQNTSLELEFFVQGALCVAFSGNCYLSAIEQNASGNRGLCKQMCRLPYKATAGGRSAEGYLLSAADICLADSLSDLIAAGVTSFKIEGRLRRAAYVGVATEYYRKLLDGSEPTREEDDELKIAFSRGEFLKRSYLDVGVPDRIVNAAANAHTGLEVGKVVRVRPFKRELYEVSVESSRELRDGDGLKFFDGKKEVASLGVGGVKRNGNIYTFVTASNIKEGWSTHLTSNSVIEDEIGKKRSLRAINVDIKAVIGQKLKISAVAICNVNGKSINVRASAEGEILQAAKSAPVSVEQFEEMAKRTADFGFDVKVGVQTDGVFVARSIFNALRRQVYASLADKIIKAYEPSIPREKVLPENAAEEAKEQRAVAVRQKHTVVKEGEIAEICPSVYSSDEVRALSAGVRGEIALRLPVIANGEDMKVIERVLRETGIKTLVSQNIYGLYFASLGYKVIAGAGHNIANKYAYKQCVDAGAYAVEPSLEYPSSLDGTGRIVKCGGELPLMTFAHCPYKTIFNNNCANCSYTGDLTLTRERRVYKVRRIRVAQCYFELFEA